jgi:SRSO17 transposase
MGCATTYPGRGLSHRRRCARARHDRPRERSAAGEVPEDVEFATKPALAREMLVRTLDAGVAARWAAGDEVYGADPALRAALEARQFGYVLVIGCDRRVSTPAGLLRADKITAGLPGRAWQQLSAGPGAKGQRIYDWARIVLDPPAEHTGPG